MEEGNSGAVVLYKQPPVSILEFVITNRESISDLYHSRKNINSETPGS